MSQNFKNISEVTGHKGAVQIGSRHVTDPKMKKISCLALWPAESVWLFKIFLESQVTSSLSDRSLSDTAVTGHTPV